MEDMSSELFFLMPQLNGFGFNVVKAASPTQAFKMIAED